MARQEKTGSTSGERQELERWQRARTREMEEVGLTVWRGGNELCGRA